MALTRRRFLYLLACFGSAAATSVRGMAARAIPARVRKALPAVSFPGRVRPFDETECQRPGPWSG